MKEFGLIILAVTHGYFAAWLAVWMLFYPREPKFIRGWRIPFTPGLIPSSRGVFEEVLAEAIAGQLLQPAAIFECAKNQGVTQNIRQAIPLRLEALMDDEEFQTKISEGVAAAIREHLHSRRNLNDNIADGALIPYTRKSLFSWATIIERVWHSVDEGIDSLCRSQQFKDAVSRSVKRTAGELRTDSTIISEKVDAMVEEIIGEGVHSLDLKAIILERLLSLSNEEIEKLVLMSAGKQLNSIKSVAAVIGVVFGLLSVFIFS